METTINTSLPPNYTVEENPCVGYDFLDERGRCVIQHPVDSNSIRALVWQYYYQRQDKPSDIISS